MAVVTIDQRNFWLYHDPVFYRVSVASPAQLRRRLQSLSFFNGVVNVTPQIINQLLIKSYKNNP